MECVHEESDLVEGKRVAFEVPEGTAPRSLELRRGIRLKMHCGRPQPKWVLETTGVGAIDQRRG